MEFLQENPKRQGSQSHGRYERYKAAKTLEEMLDLGGTRGDIYYDMARGYIKEAIVEDGGQIEAHPSNIVKEKMYWSELRCQDLWS